MFFIAQLEKKIISRNAIFYYVKSKNYRTLNEWNQNLLISAIFLCYILESIELQPYKHDDPEETNKSTNTNESTNLHNYSS